MDTLPLLLFLLASAASAASGQQVIRVQPGHDTTLRCEAGDVFIRAVEWTRPDLKPENVLFYSDGHFDTDEQHPSFTGRVGLEDRDLKGGDVSLILKNVTRSDSGTYECRVASGGSRLTKRALIKRKPIRDYRLEVTGAWDGNSMDENTESEHPINGHSTLSKNVGLAAGCVAVLLLL